MAGTITPSRSARNSPQPAWIACLLVRKSRAEQDWQDARSERPATGHGQPRATRGPVRIAYAIAASKEHELSEGQVRIAYAIAAS
jgi:hypothetical protein